MVFEFVSINGDGFLTQLVYPKSPETVKYCLPRLCIGRFSSEIPAAVIREQDQRDTLSYTSQSIEWVMVSVAKCLDGDQVVLVHDS